MQTQFKVVTVYLTHHLVMLSWCFTGLLPLVCIIIIIIVVVGLKVQINVSFFIDSESDSDGSPTIPKGWIY